MKRGRWIPLSKALISALPRDRDYTELEAMYSLSVDYDNGSTVTITGYSSLWRWSRGKVTRFFNKIGATIIYPIETVKAQNQRGQIAIQILDRKQSDNGQIMFIDSRQLQEETNKKLADNEQKKSKTRGATKEPNPKPEPEQIKESNFVLPDWIDKTVWSAFIEIRKRKKVPDTDFALSLIIKELGKLKNEGHTPESVLNNSIMRGYTGVFGISERRAKSEKPRSTPSYGLDTGSEQFIAATGG